MKQDGIGAKNEPEDTDWTKAIFDAVNTEGLCLVITGRQFKRHSFGEQVGLLLAVQISAARICLIQDLVSSQLRQKLPDMNYRLIQMNNQVFLSVKHCLQFHMKSDRYDLLHQLEPIQHGSHRLKQGEEPLSNGSD